MAITRIGPNQSINLVSNVTGTLPTGNGGTGATSFTAPSLVKISNTTISSGVANVTLEPSNFTDYKVYCIIANRMQVANDNMNFRMLIQDTSGSTYRSAEYASRTGDGTPGATSYFLLSWDNLGNNTSGSLIYEDYSAQIFLTGFEANRRLRYFGNVSYGDTSSNKRSFDVGGGTNYTEEVTGIKFTPSSGNFLSGQITLYGVTTA